MYNSGGFFFLFSVFSPFVFHSDGIGIQWIIYVSRVNRWRTAMRSYGNRLITKRRGIRVDGGNPCSASMLPSRHVVDNVTRDKCYTRAKRVIITYGAISYSGTAIWMESLLCPVVSNVRAKVIAAVIVNTALVLDVSTVSVERHPSELIFFSFFSQTSRRLITYSHRVDPIRFRLLIFQKAPQTPFRLANWIYR